MCCDLRFPVETADQALGLFRRSLWLASLVILLVAGMAALLVSRGFSDRVERLQEFSRRVAEGDFRPLPGDGSGDALEMLGASLNQTAARMDRTIRTLTEERNLSSAILGSMVEGVAVVNGAERLVFANQGFADILELDVPPKSGSALVEIVRQTELIEAVRQVLAGEPRVEAEIVTGTLRQHFFAATVAAVRAGETSGAVVVLHDITELRKLERVRRDFVANVSHEFKTPLTAIQGFSETLLAGAIDDPQNRERFLGIILEHSRRLARLTDDLLKLSQMDADRLELEIRRVSVAELIESCLETAQHRAAEKDIRVSVSQSSELPDIAGDRRRLAEVLQNLLDNATQYTLPGGRITLSAEVRDADVDLHCLRYRHWHPQSRPVAHFRALLPRGRRAVARGRRHRAGPGHRQASGRSSRRPHLGGERNWARFAVSFFGSGLRSGARCAALRGGQTRFRWPYEPSVDSRCFLIFTLL